MLTAQEADRLEQLARTAPAELGTKRCVRCDEKRSLADRQRGGQMCAECEREAGDLVTAGLCVSCEMPLSGGDRQAGQLVCPKCDLSY